MAARKAPKRQPQVKTGYQPGKVAQRYAAMATEEAQAAYSRTFVSEYRRAWEKSWDYLLEMMDIIKAKHLYSKPYMIDGVWQPTYETFEEFCEAEVEPFVGPIAAFRDQQQRG